MGFHRGRRPFPRGGQGGNAGRAPSRLCDPGRLAPKSQLRGLSQFQDKTGNAFRVGCISNAPERDRLSGNKLRLPFSTFWSEPLTMPPDSHFKAPSAAGRAELVVRKRSTSWSLETLSSSPWQHHCGPRALSQSRVPVQCGLHGAARFPITEDGTTSSWAPSPEPTHHFVGQNESPPSRVRKRNSPRARGRGRER